MIQLHTHPFSTFGRRVHMAVLEKGLDVKIVEVDMARRAQKSDAYMAMHPYGRVPTLVDGSFVLPESVAILQYLEAKFPEPALLPQGLQDRALVAMHMHLCDIELSSNTYAMLFSKRFVPEEKWRREKMDAGKKAVAHHLAVLGKQLGEREFLVADQFTLADLSYVPFLQFLDLMEVEVPDNIRAWANRLLARPSAMATKPAM